MWERAKTEYGGEWFGVADIATLLMGWFMEDLDKTHTSMVWSMRV